jgi:large subunit ribosomal protein L24
VARTNTAEKRKAFGHIKKYDQVMVISGKDRGKTGKVLKVLLKSEQVIVEKANMIKKHQKARKVGQKGGIIEKEGPIHVSNVVLICSKCKKPTKISYNYLENEIKKLRVCKLCGEIVEKGAD